jgi:hypothetical protein
MVNSLDNTRNLSQNDFPDHEEAPFLEETVVSLKAEKKRFNLRQVVLSLRGAFFVASRGAFGASGALLNYLEASCRRMIRFLISSKRVNPYQIKLRRGVVFMNRLSETRMEFPNGKIVDMKTVGGTGARDQPAFTDGGEFTSYFFPSRDKREEELLCGNLPKCESAGKIFHDATLVRAANGRIFVSVNVHADSGEGKSEKNIAEIKALKEHFETYSYPVLVGGDSNIYYGGQDKKKQAHTFDDQQRFATEMDMNVVLSTTAVRKKRPGNFFKNAQAAYKKEELSQESMFICVPKEVAFEELVQEYPNCHILSPEPQESVLRVFQTETGERLNYQLKDAFSYEVPSDHDALVVEYEGVDLVFSNNVNIRDKKRGLVQSVFIEGTDPTDEQSSAFGKEVFGNLLHLQHELQKVGLYKTLLAAEETSLKSLSGLAMEKIAGEKIDEEKITANEGLFYSYLGSLYDLACVQGIIPNSLEYQKCTREDLDHKSSFLAEVHKNMMIGIKRKGTLEYATNSFFSELHSTAVAGFDAERLYPNAQSWQKAMIDTYSQKGGCNRPCLLFCCEDKD